MKNYLKLLYYDNIVRTRLLLIILGLWVGYAIGYFLFTHLFQWEVIILLSLLGVLIGFFSNRTVYTKDNRIASICIRLGIPVFYRDTDKD